MTMTTIHPLYLAALGGLLFIPAAHAQEAADLDTVTVTATRTAEAVERVLAAVEVIDRAQIERSQAQSLPQLLQGHAGVQTVNQGGPGKLSSVFLRGTDSDHLLVLVDGVRVGSTTAGTAALQDLPLAQIERIEIVRGPHSGLYGADAIGGVIHVFTRGGGKPGTVLRAHAGVGSHGWQDAGAGLDWRGQRGWLGADVAHQQTDGIDACRVATPTPFSGGCFIAQPQPDRDGYRNRSLSLRGGWQPVDALELRLQGLRAEGRNDFDGDFIDRSDTLQQVLGGRLAWTASERVRVSLSAGRNTDISDNALQGMGVNRYRSTRDSAGLQLDWDLAAQHAISAGLDWQRDAADVADAFSPFAAERDNRAGFVQYRGQWNRQSLQAAVRHDDNAQFGGHGTGHVAWGLQLNDAWRLNARYGTAFKAPSFNDLYFPFFGNPDLQPETARSVELGLRHAPGSQWHWQAQLYRTRIDDLIAFDVASGKPANLDAAQIQGAEFTMQGDMSGWQWSTQLGYTHALSVGGFADGAWLPRRARWSGRIDLDRRHGDWSWGVSAVGQGRRYDDVANTLPLGGYGTLDARVAWQPSAQWQLQAGVRNLLDKTYETASFYRQPGREWLLQLRYRRADD